MVIEIYFEFWVLPVKIAAMSKEKSPTKDKNKKEPEKNLKEKRAEKKAKREGKK